MKNQVPQKPFKRKTSTTKFVRLQHHRNSCELSDARTRFLSPKTMKGLDTAMYKNQLTIVKGLQQEVYILRQKVAKLQKDKCELKDQNWKLREDNKKLRQEIEEYKERQKRSNNEHYDTVEALKDLKQKIEMLSQEQLSTVDTVDDLETEGLCCCQKYRAQITTSKDKIKFLQESLLHSEEIIHKLQKHIKKIKTSKQEITLSDLEMKAKKGLKKMSVKKKLKAQNRVKFNEEIKEVNEE